MKQFSSNIYTVMFRQLIVITICYIILRLVFYFYYLDFFQVSSLKELMIINFGGLRFDWSAIFYLNSLYILLVSVPLDIRLHKKYKRVVFWSWIIPNAFGLAIMMIDLAYFNFSMKRATVSLISFFFNLPNSGSLLIEFFLSYWYFFILYFLLIYGLVLVYKRQDYHWIVLTNNFKKRLIYSAGIFVLCVFLVITGMRGGWSYNRPLNVVNATAFVNKPFDQAVVLNSVFTFLQSISDTGIPKINFYNKEDSELKQWTNIHTIKNNHQYVGKMRGKNIVLLVLEGFGETMFSRDNEAIFPPGTTTYAPFLDSLFYHGLWFKGVANARQSVDGIPSIIESIPSYGYHYNMSEYFSNSFKGLPIYLKKYGYKSYFFHGAEADSFFFNDFSKMAGFDAHYSRKTYNNDEDYSSWGIWDEEFLQYTAKVLSSKQEPFFATIYTLSSHHPFDIPKKYIGKFPKGTDIIHESIGYTDYSVKKFFESIKYEPWYEHTLFVFVPDHVSHQDAKKYTTGHGMFRIPIVFFTPDGSIKAELSNKKMQQLDIKPSLLALVGFDEPYFSFGTNIFDSTANHFSVNYLDGTYQMVKGDYIFQRNLEQPLGLYNLKQDSLMKQNLLLSKEHQYKEKKEQMDELLKVYLQQYYDAIIENNMKVKKKGISLD